MMLFGSGQQERAICPLNALQGLIQDRMRDLGMTKKNGGLNLSELARRAGLNRTTIWELVTTDPAPACLGRRPCGWWPARSRSPLTTSAMPHIVR